MLPKCFHFILKSSSYYSKSFFPLYLIELLFTLIYQTSNIFAGYLPQKNSEILAAVSLTESIVIFIGHYVFFNIPGHILSKILEKYLQ